MTNYETCSRLINELKSCTKNETSGKIDIVTSLFTHLTPEEQNKIVYDFNFWAEENFKKEPLKNCYAKYLLALKYFLGEKYETCFEALCEAQKLFEKEHNAEGKAICLSLLGAIYRTFGSYDLALSTLLDSYEVLKNSDSIPFYRAACSCTIANVYFEMQQVDDALQMFRITYEYTETVNNFFWNNYALHGLARVYIMKKEYPTAKDYLEKSLVVAQKINNSMSIANSYSELANYYYLVENLPEAERLNKISLEIREKNNYQGASITSYIRLGEIYMKESRPEDALAVFAKVLKMAEKLKVKPKLFRIHLLLSQTYQSKGDLENSLFHYKLFHEMREQSEREENTRKINNARLLFKAGQTQKENITIKKQKEEIEKKNMELRHTIDALTRARIGKKAKAFTLAIAIVLFIFEDSILHFALDIIASDNYYISLLVKMLIIFSLSPINKAIEHYLMKKIMINKNQPSEEVSVAVAA